MIGYSIGEYVAAWLAVGFSLEDAIALVAVLSEADTEITCRAMLGVALAEHEIRPFLDSGIIGGCTQRSSHCVVAGMPEAVER
jgi:acyl transferase domain-containing protein